MEDSMLHADLGPVLAGPILRKVTRTRLALWLAVRAQCDIRLEVQPVDGTLQTYEWLADQGATSVRQIKAGEHLVYLLIDCVLDDALPADHWIRYRLSLHFLDEPQAGWQDHTIWGGGLCYPGHDWPGFQLCSHVGALLHGSCRKPHHDAGDGLVAADAYVARHVADLAGNVARPGLPAALVMSGDQIYADDVAGPMLRAIHQVIARLGLPQERLDELDVALPEWAGAMYGHPHSYYQRELFLPKKGPEPDLMGVLFRGVEKPIFTSVNAHNHLITLAELLAMYLLVWSPVAWEGLDLSPPGGLSEEHLALYHQELTVIAAFRDDLAKVRRVMAHLPVAMIFDDHDITDDWNLNRAWEETAYGHDFSRRIIGNALIAYLINQGWGNHPDAFSDIMFGAVQSCLMAPGQPHHDAFIEALLDFEGWDFHWETEPLLIVLDTRTRRWRSESSAHQPSGLLDWEAVTDLQRLLRGRDSVMLVSAAPIFGVKLIETLQKFMTSIGKPLMVDAEYWMAHPGTASSILNVFRHRKTPDRFTILSGDVHYSFVYDVELKGKSGGPDIWQICSSGIKNEFPRKLLKWLDHLNRWLYAPRSPLNWLTSRRAMRIVPRKPEGMAHGRRLLNRAGIGLVQFDEVGAPTEIAQLLPNGDRVVFERREKEARWD